MVESIQQFVKDKRIIFVGNSVEIMNHKLAEFIDKYDIVVRFGRAIEANDLQEESIGTKCDIWITGQFRAPSFNNVKEEFETGKFKNTKILVNRSRGNLKLKDWILEDRLPKDFPEYTEMYSDEELIDIMKEFDKDLLDTNEYRPSAGFISLLWFIDKVKTYKSIDLIGFDFFAKTINKRPRDKRGKVSNCNPHSWHLPVYVLNRPAHDKIMEQQYVSSLQKRGIINWHMLSDLTTGEVPYTGWMQGLKIVKTAPKYSKISKILPRSQQ
jgi:hypothetical protein|tara:strand:- start:6 stop:812 length:807 start_codon:yes stop_codon:yes gene_type:complete